MTTEPEVLNATTSDDQDETPGPPPEAEEPPTAEDTGDVEPDEAGEAAEMRQFKR